MEPIVAQAVTVIVSLFLLIQLCTSVGYGDECTSDSECTNANIYCKASFSKDCNSKCTCQRHMVWDASDSKCKVKKYFVDKCNTNMTSCQAGSQCSGSDGQCVCNGITNNYYTPLQKCINKLNGTWKVIGDDCSTAEDCYQEISGAVECVVPTGSTITQKKCACTSGYIESKSSCRKPHYGEQCSTEVGCGQEIVVTESSVRVEICPITIPHICTCPSCSTKLSIEEDGLIASICHAVPHS